MAHARRRLLETRPKLEISEGVWNYLCDIPYEDLDSETKFAIILLEAGDGEALREVWGRARGEVLGAWLKDHPGTRPAVFWRFDTPHQPLGTHDGCFYDGKLPQPRKQISGAGCPAWAVMAHVPAYSLGLPTLWAGYEPSNPPVFESQAAYLRRHGLLAVSEKRILTPADFAATEELDPACEVDLGPFEGPDAAGVRWLNEWGASIRGRIIPASPLAP